MRVTVAICTWNRCELLRQTLEQLTAVTVPPGMALDVVVVNNNCTDATDAVVDQFSERLPIRRVFEPKPGLSNARNAALAAASGDYVIFTDDDVLIGESWLVEFQAATQAFPGAAAIGGIIEPWFPVKPDPDLVAAFPSWGGGFQGLDHRREAGPLPDGLGLWGANMAFRRASLGALAFDPELGFTPTSAVGAEEIDFQRRLRAAGGCVIWWPTMKLRHYVAPSRVTATYLLKYTAGKGAEYALTSPAGAAPTLFGAPRWLWLVLAKTAWVYAAHAGGSDVTLSPSFSGPLAARQASRRARGLAIRRELAFVRGMIRGHRQLTARRAGEGS